ncbi:hypothetical protein [Flavobacterium selenitireducens]|uniref:hypothetical protein n=1 Tax=Flavobacterium selenitireducens TaxID=2722704 RepID=UPI00168B4AE3|nr:hypothetical protein [Flavobacterium selenitireducens]MBD3581763.1 hypothetical protein [Flavobacterium selenitireducens]
MRFWLPILLLFCSLCVFAQPDTGKNRLSIPPVTPPETKAPVVTPPKKDPYYVPPSISGDPIKNYNLNTDKPINFGAPKPKFENPGDAIAERINSEGSGSKSFPELRQNKHMGEFRVTSTMITVSYQDIGPYVDGERITVYVNERAVMELHITGARQSMEIPLSDGFNKVALKVSNVGTVYPSSIYFEVTDDKGRLLTSDSWFADIGIVSDMVIIKE